MPQQFGNAERPTSMVPQTRGLISNHTDGRELFKIYVVNLLLMIVTLGIYRFWGKTRMRRYLWGNVEILGDRLEYTGTGKELFLGFLVIFFLVLLPLFALSAFLEQMLLDADERLVALLGSGQVLVVLFLVGMAVFRARRYRLTRTHWRGIYGAQTGSSVKYSLMVLASYALLVLTLGLAWPACSVWLKRYEMANTWIGDEQPQFTPSTKKLYRSFMVAWGFVFAVMVLLTVVIAGVSVITEAGDVNPEVAVGILALVFVVYAMFVPAFLLFLWYRGKALHHFVSVTRFHGHDLTSSITGFGYMWLIVSNVLLAIVTLGLAVPYIYKRNLNFVERHVGLQGSGDFSALLQSTQEKPTRGEGLADAFDIGGI